MYEKQLYQIGLSEKEAKVYEILLNLGKAGIGQILKKVPYKRGDTYNILYNLINKELISESLEKNKKIFILENPDRLQELINKQEKQIQQGKEILSLMLPDIKVHYNTISDRPGVKFLEGLDGFQKVYSDILKTKRDLRIFASTHARLSPEMEKIINHNIFKQHQLGIKTRALAHITNVHSSQKSIQELQNFGVELHLIPDSLIMLPSQVIIYANKTVITSLKNEILSTLIENDNISNSLKNIFDLLWNLTQAISQSIYKSLPVDDPNIKGVQVIEELKKISQL